MSDQYPPQNPYGQQPGPYGQQPGPYGQQPGPYGQQPTGPRQPPLWAPWYGIPFAQAFPRFWKKYVRFDGRASKSEYWFWALWYVIGNAATGLIGGALGLGMSDGTNRLTWVWMLATFIGFIALTVRRLHDVNLSGYFALFFIIPPIGVLFSLIVGLIGTVPQGQQYDRPDRA